MTNPVVHQVGIFDGSGNFYFPRDVVSGSVTIEAAGGSSAWTGGKPLKSVYFEIDDGSTTVTSTQTAEQRSAHEDTKFAAKALAAVAGGASSLVGNLGVFRATLDTTLLADGEATVTIEGTGGDDTTHSYTFVLWINNTDSISDDEVWIDADSGDDSTGDGSEGSPWETWEKARNYAAANHSGTNRVIINAVGGTTAEYSRTRGSGFSRQTVGPRVITRGVGGSRAKFDIPSNAECRVSFQKWENCNFDATNGWVESSGQPNDLAFVECDLKSDLGRASMTYTSGPLFEGADVDAVYMYRCEIGDYNRKGITTKAWMRDSWIIDVSEDAIGAEGAGAGVGWPGNCYFAVYCEDTDTQYTGLGDPHGDGLQILQAGTSHHNILVANCVFNDVGYSGQCFLGDNAVGLAMYNLAFIHTDGSVVSFSQFGDASESENVIDVVVANLTHPNHGFGWREANNTVSDSAIHSAIIKDFRAGLGTTGTASTDIAETETISTTSDSEVTVLSANPFTNGVDYDENYTESKNHYRPKPSSGLPTVAAGDRFTAYDLLGAAIPDDGTALVGAMQEYTPTALEPGTPTGNVTGAYMNAGASNLFIVFDGPVAYSGGSPYPITVTNGTGSTELVTEIVLTTTTVLNDTLNVVFGGDAVQAGDTNWTCSLSNGAGKLTGADGVPIADFTDLAVTVLGGSSGGGSSVLKSRSMFLKRIARRNKRR
jgi:hypothetical protein